MDDALFLVPVALFLGFCALVAFLWALREGQYNDLQGAAERVLYQGEDLPIRSRKPAAAPATREAAGKELALKDVNPDEHHR